MTWPSVRQVRLVSCNVFALKTEAPVFRCRLPPVIQFEASGVIKSLQAACYWKTANNPAGRVVLPHFVVEFIFNLAAAQMVRDKMQHQDGVFKQIHHALQPCSVCGNLVAVEVDEKGEIQSSGRLFRYLWNHRLIRRNYRRTSRRKK